MLLKQPKKLTCYTCCLVILDLHIYCYLCYILYIYIFIYLYIIYIYILLLHIYYFYLFIYIYIYIYIYFIYCLTHTHTHVHIAHTSCWEKSQKGLYAMLSQTKEGSTSLGSTYWVYIIGLNYFQVKTRRKKMNLKCLLTASLCFERVHQLIRKHWGTCLFYF